MKTPVRNIKEAQGFKKVCKVYFDYVFDDQDMKGKKKQESPFILFKGDTVKAIWTISELIDETDDHDYYYTVFQAWPGKKRTDVFVFDIADMDDYMEMVWAPKMLAKAGEKGIRKPDRSWSPPPYV